MSMPIMFMTSIVGLSPKKSEIGGVAPTESPPPSDDVSFPSPDRLGLGTSSNHGFRNAAPPMPKRRPERVRRLRERDQLAVVVADVEDRHLGELLRRP